MVTRHVGCRFGASWVGAVVLGGVLTPAPSQAQDVSIAAARAAEGDAAITFTLTMSPASASAVTVHYWTGDDDDGDEGGWSRVGLATGGRDYVETSGLLTFEPGETVKTISVTILDDGESEGEEAFLLSASSDDAYVWPEWAYGVILDDEALPFGCGTDGATYCYVRFPIRSVYDPHTGAWQPGAGSVRVKVTFIFDGHGWEEDEWYSRWQHRHYYYEFMRIITSSGRGGATLPWRDGNESFWDCREVFDVDEEAGTRVLSEASLSQDTFVSGDCTDEADGPCGFSMEASRESNPPDGCWNLYTRFAFAYDELPLVGRFRYTEAGYVFGPASFSPEPQVTVSDARGDSERGAVRFTVGLDLASPARTTVEYATVDGSAVAGADYAAVSGTLVFEPGELSKTVEVAIVEDRLPEGDETFDLVLSNPVGAGMARGLGTATIADDDIARPNLVVSELRAVRAVTSGGSVTVRYEVQNAGEAAAPASHVLMALSPDQLLWTHAVPALAPGECSAGAATVALPALDTGTYTLLVLADSELEVSESRESDNWATKLLVAGPDLRVSITLPPGVVAGSPVAVAVRTRNLGSDGAAPSITRLYRSADGSLDATDTVVGELAVPALAPRTSVIGHLPVTLTSGTWWLIGRSDAEGTTSEALETNNVRRVRITVP